MYRIGIMGASYGDCVTLAALPPDVFNVGVDIFGVANWLRTLESIPKYSGADRGRWQTPPPNLFGRR